MTVTHRGCGGRFLRSDVIQTRSGSIFYIQETDSKVAHWRCNKCNAERTQRKRQPREEVPTMKVVFKQISACSVEDMVYKRQISVCYALDQNGVVWMKIGINGEWMKFEVGQEEKKNEQSNVI